MWTDNTRNAKIRGAQIEVFKILNGYEHIDYNILFKNKSGWMVESIHFPREPPMYGIYYQLIVHMLLVLKCSRIE